jgi:endonuclease/exonuclease/phosphatase family metal-dependent hydrolase
MIVATYNIKRGMRPDGEVDLALLASSCASLGADVLALQEVVIHDVDTVAMVAEACGMTGVFAKAIEARAGGQYGNALLVRGTVEGVEEVPFPDDTEPRSAMVADIGVDAARVAVATGHLGLRGQAADELPVLLARLALRARPWLVLGDLNLRLRDAARILEGAGLVVVDAGGTFPVRRPTRQIDHVAVAGARIVASEVVHLPVSDHRALVVDLEVV